MAVVGEWSGSDTRWSDAQARLLLRVLTAVTSHRERDTLFGAVAELVAEMFSYDHFFIVLDGPAEGFISVYFTRPELSIPPLPKAQSALARVFETGQPLYVRDRAQVAHSSGTMRVLEKTQCHSYLAVPMPQAGKVQAVMILQSRREGAYDGIDLALAVQVGRMIAVALARCLAYEELRRSHERIEQENAVMRGELDARVGSTRIVGDSDALREVLNLVSLVAPTDATVLIHGETGTGKELIARAVHAGSARAARPLVTLNCAAIPSGLVESELFGHEQGAFTDAGRKRRGRFEMAHRSTLFLDEIGELPADAQAKLLRVLQTQEFERVGGSETVKVDVRVIAATNRDLLAMVQRGEFRADLYYRLAVFPITLPPLRERAEDIAPLAKAFAVEIALRHGTRLPDLDEAGLLALRHYRWPGNVRELQNVIERAVILSESERLDVEQLLPPEEQQWAD